MIRKKTSGVTLFAALATGLSSCYSVSAIDNESNTNNKVLNGTPKDKSSSVEVAKLLTIGISSVGTAGLAGGTALAASEFNKNSEINAVNQLNSKIKEQENAINRLTRTYRKDLSLSETKYENKIKEQKDAIEVKTSRENLSPGEINYEDKIKELKDVIAQLTQAAEEKINEIKNVKHSGEQANKQETNPFATVMYVTVSLVMITFLASLLLILYKLKNAGVFEAIDLVGSIIKSIKETFGIKKDLSLEGLRKKLVTVKEILKDPQGYVYKEIKKSYSKLNGIELKNIVSLEEFKNEYKSLLESNDGYTYKKASTSKAVSKVLNSFKEKYNLDTFPANKVSKPKTDISDTWKEIPGSIRLNGKREVLCLDPIFREDIAYKAVLECLKKEKEKLQNENKENLKEIEKIKKEKSEQEFDNIAIRKANFLKLKKNQKELQPFYNEFAKLDSKVTEVQTKFKQSYKSDNKAKEEYDKFMKEYKPKRKTAEHLFKIEEVKQQGKLLLNEEVEEEVDTKKYDTKISKLDKEIEENNKKILKIDILNSKLERKEHTIIKIISKERTLDSIFNKINDYIKKETADDDFDKIVKLVNDYANALKEGNLINLISEQKVGKEKLEKTIIPALEHVKNVAIFLNEKRKNLNKNEIVDIEHQNTNLEVIIKNVTNLLEATEKTMKDLHGKEISYTSFSSKTITFAGLVEVFKNNYNEINME